VRFDCDGDLRTVSPTAGLALYRIVQESLANVARHTSGAPANVAIHIDTDIQVEVRNPSKVETPASPARDGNGLGLRLMRDRAESLGGTLHAGPDGDQWRVCAVIPAAAPS
jgi:signal transduction histidine kinase